MKKIYFLLFTLLLTATSYSQVVINEIDADQAGTDMGEFIELKGTPNASLDGLVVVLYNGNSDTSYAAYDLDGKTLDANGFFILGNTGIISGSDIDMGADNGLQNGADAVAIYTANDTDFPDATPATTTNIVDALVYGTGDPDDTDLMTALGETTQYDESLNGASATESLQRTDDGTNYETKIPTFRDDNNAAVCDLSLGSTSATCDAFTAGVDTYTATLDFVGGGTSTYTVMSDSGTVDLTGGNDPSVDATGTITVTGVNEGTDVTITVQDGGLCDFSPIITSPICVPTASLPISDDFTYPDGSLVGNGTWVSTGGTAGDFMVSGGQAVVQHGAPSEDVNIPFQPVAGNLYYAFDFSVIDPGGPIAGTDNEYFAHFKDDSFNFSARMDIVPPSAAGDFSVGIASDESTADATWATDLDYGTTYRVTVRYDQDANIAELWIDAASEGDTSILGEDRADPGDSVASFAFRQSDSDLNEGILVDNLKVAQTFAGTTLSTNDFSTTTFKVYPNPTSTGFVNITSANSEDMTVSVFDILGKQVINKTISNNSLNVSALNTGIYIMKISQNNATVTKKLVIR